MSAQTPFDDKNFPISARMNFITQDGKSSFANTLIRWIYAK